MLFRSALCFLPDELLPPPKSEALPKPLLVSSNLEPTSTTQSVPECKVGWGTDASDQSMYLVIQIAPDAIAQFAAGGRSMELESIIPQPLRGRIQKVLIRVGTGPVEQSPPESELARLPSLSATSPTANPAKAPEIANLDLRSPVNIDLPRSERATADIVPAANANQVPVVPGLTIPTTPTGAPPSLPGEVLPTTPSLSTYGTTPAYGNPSTYGSTVVSTPIPSSPQTTASSTAGYTNDGFAPMPRTVPSTLNPFARTSTASSGLPPTTASSASLPNTQGNVTYSTTAQPPTYGSSAGSGYGNNSYGNVPHLASNPATYPYNTNGQAQNPPPGGYVLPTDNYSGYGNQAYNGNYHNNAITNPVLPIPQIQNRPLPSTSQNTGTLTLPSTGRELDSIAANSRGTLLPFFLVLSFILNVYFGLWLNHLSTKYRHLLGSVRGLAPSMES